MANTTETTVQNTAAEESVIVSLGLNGQLFAFQLLNFAIVFSIVWFMILKPLTEKMDERRKLIDESLDKAKEVETNFQLSQQQFKEKMEEAKAEANNIIAASHEQASALQVKMKEQAKSEIDVLVSQAKKNLQAEKEAMVAEAKQEIATLVVSAVEKVVGEKLDAEKDRNYIKQVVDSLT